MKSKGKTVGEEAVITGELAGERTEAEEDGGGEERRWRACGRSGGRWSRASARGVSGRFLALEDQHGAGRLQDMSTKPGEAPVYGGYFGHGACELRARRCRRL